MKIFIISPGYPDIERPFFVFVERLVNELADQGHLCKVISPQSITNSLVRRTKLSKRRRTFSTRMKNRIEIYQPYYLSFSSYKFGQYISFYSRKRSIERAYRSIGFVPDVFYCHFWQQGFETHDLAARVNVPLFVATGESTIKLPSYIGLANLTRCSDYVSGVICVSDKNRKESVNLKLATDDKCVILSNAVDQHAFSKMNRSDSRRILGFSKDTFIVAFVGAFNERKGSARLSQALELIADDEIEAIFIGKGNDKPSYDNIIYCGPLENKDIALYLNCADIFVLPTLREGCSNAIVEAMACGLPIVSSDLDFNRDILNSKNSIKIDPLNIEELAQAIRKLKEQSRSRINMGFESLRIADNLTIENRAKSIIQFMKDRLDK